MHASSSTNVHLHRARMIGSLPQFSCSSTLPSLPRTPFQSPHDLAMRTCICMQRRRKKENTNDTSPSAPSECTCKHASTDLLTLHTHAPRHERPIGATHGSRKRGVEQRWQRRKKKKTREKKRQASEANEEPRRRLESQVLIHRVACSVRVHVFLHVSEVKQQRLHVSCCFV